MSRSGFNPNLRTIMMISGYLTRDYVDWMERTKDLWLQLEDVNVILVSWSSSNKFIYSSAVANTPLVGRQITIFLNYLAEMNGYDLFESNFAENIHFIGHSLGAHIAGFLGSDLSGKLGRITGLDPAGPSFDLMPRSNRLDQTDALLVDVIHTNSGHLHYLNAAASAVVQVVDSAVRKAPIINSLSRTLSSDYSGEGETAYFGINEQVGHVDYYANSGRVQPGCSGVMHLCDHGRSHEIYEGILRYELIMRRYSNSKDWLKQNRLLAFSSIDYENFLSGNNFNVQCPLVLRGREFLNKAHDETFKHCSIPMDFMTPVNELRQELSNEYNINFNNNVNFQTDRKYYFKTHSEKPFVGFHNLLKIHLDRSNNWDSSCALKAKIFMNQDDISTEIELNKDLNLIQSEDFSGIAMPFVNPLGPEARIAYDFILNNPENLQQSEVFEVLDRILPSKIKIEISGAPSTGVMEVVKNRLINLGFSNKASAKCYLEILAIEVHQLDNSKRSIAGLYGASRNFDNELRARVINREEYSSMVRNSYQLSAESKQTSITEKLDTLLITV